MQTNFTLAQLADPAVANSEKILRSCVHCGFCTATCPTYVLLGDELDSPRGRIYLIKDMLEGGKPANEQVTRHVDRCLSCLACMTTCPSGVDYMHLVDHARAHIHETYRRPFADRLIRSLLAFVLPYPERFRAALRAARLGRPFAGLVAALPGGNRLSAMLRLAPSKLPASSAAGKPGTFPARGARKGRVALLRGCAQSVLDPGINAATIRLLNRHGVEVVQAENEGCCGALVHHMGRTHDSHEQAKRNIDAWTQEIDGGGLDAIIVTTSGCGTTVKDYGFMLRLDPDYAEKARRVSALARDVSEYLETLDLGEPANGVGPERRLSFRLLAPAWPAGEDGAESVARPRRLRCARRRRRAFVLRLGRHLQHAPAGNFGPPARPQARQYRGDRRRDRRRRQHRLHHADRQRRHAARRAHRRTARLGLWRAEAGAAGGAGIHSTLKRIVRLTIDKSSLMHK